MQHFVPSCVLLDKYPSRKIITFGPCDHGLPLLQPLVGEKDRRRDSS